MRPFLPVDDAGRVDPCVVARFRRALDELPLIRRQPGRPSGSGYLGRSFDDALALYRAKQRLAGRPLTPAEFSDLIGYADPRDMRRALRRLGVNWNELVRAA